MGASMKVSVLRYFAYGAALLLAFGIGHASGNASLLQKVGAYFADALSDPKTSAAVASAVFALLSLAVQFLVGNKQAIIGTRQAEASRISADAASLTAKNAGDRAIATMRIEWITELRKTISEYHSILMTHSKMTTDSHLKLSNLGTQLDLLLNVDDPAQRDLWDILDQIYKTTGMENRQKFDDDLIRAGRAVMKEEWEKIKREMRARRCSEGSHVMFPVPNERRAACSSSPANLPCTANSRVVPRQPSDNISSLPAWKQLSISKRLSPIRNIIPDGAFRLNLGSMQGIERGLRSTIPIL
jgi:hypothetical protein